MTDAKPKITCVLVTGSRDWGAYLPIRRELEKLDKGTVIIHGACKGADTLADLAAKHLKLDRIPFPITDDEWRTLGPKAGPMRNARMIGEGKPQLVLAFHPNIEASKGTKDCVARARAANITVKIIAS